ncbi:MAG TPA: large conductance mechanosensitive channel protein MscL [Beutenbergiaceae bacterium]|nr:large conductance mechanosensitive channel protein MscL [Beutenbergiaceae bacterium]
MLQGFKEFISRGSAIDLAVGVVIGAAFSAVIDALVNSVINPLIAGLFGEPDFERLIVISVGQAEILPGAVLNTLIQFLLVAAALYFVVVLPMNKLAERRGIVEEEEIAEDVKVLTEIRDLLSRPTPGATDRP